MPIELEIGLLCQEFGTTPESFGFDNQDPRFIRQVKTCLAIWRSVQSRNAATDKRKWNEEHPESRSIIRWARGGESEHPDPTEVKITLPERPARRRG
jgi:hypothetical protein